MLLREGHTAQNYLTRDDNTILFRRSDSTGNQEQVTLYYSNDCAISKGDIVTYNGANYLVTNKNHWESNVHFKSNAIKCNQVWYLPGMTIPVLVNELSQPQPAVGSVLTTVDGYLQVRTSDIPYFHTDFPINTKVNIIGGSYYLVNKSFVDGVCYLAFVRETTLTGMTARIGCPVKDTYTAGESTTLHPYVYMTDQSGAVVYVPDAEFAISSSDANIATCDGNYLSLLADGTADVSISATGLYESGGVDPAEINLTYETTLNVDSAADGYTMALQCASDQTIKVGGSYKTLTVTFIDVDGADVTDSAIADMSAEDFVWSYTVGGADVADLITEAAGTTANIIKIKFASDRSYIAKTLLVTCECGGMNTEIELTIAAL